MSTRHTFLKNQVQPFSASFLHQYHPHITIIIVNNPTLHIPQTVHIVFIFPAQSNTPSMQGNVNLENSRFNWVFLNPGLPHLNWRKNNGTRRRYSQLCRHFEIYKSIKENTWITLLQLIWSFLNVDPFIKFSYFLLIHIYNIDNVAASATAAAPAGLVDVEARDLSPCLLN